MLKLNKEEVHFLVTAEMKKEVADFLEAVDAKIAPVLEYIKENQVERVCFIGCGSSSAAGSTAKYLADKYTTLTVNAYTGWEFVDSMPVYGDRKTLAVYFPVRNYRRNCRRSEKSQKSGIYDSWSVQQERR